MGVVHVRAAAEDRPPGQLDGRWQVLLHAERGEELREFRGPEGGAGAQAGERVAHQPGGRGGLRHLEHVQEGVRAQAQGPLPGCPHRGEASPVQAHQGHAQAQVLHAGRLQLKLSLLSRDNPSPLFLRRDIQDGNDFSKLLSTIIYYPRYRFYTRKTYIHIYIHEYIFILEGNNKYWERDVKRLDTYMYRYGEFENIREADENRVF